jgi:hypothetical protein
VIEILHVFAFDDEVVEKTSAFFIHWNQYYILTYLRFTCLHTLGQNLRKQKNTMSQAAIARTTKYTKLIQETTKPLPDGDGNWQNADKHY